MTEVRRVAVVSTGVIGASWAAHFLARGLDVVATDPAPDAEERLRAGWLTARGVDRTLRVAWSIADLQGAPRPGLDEMHAALGLRGMSRVAA